MGIFSFLKAKKLKKEQEIAAFAMAAPSYLRIARDSIELLRNTTNPSTFFSRYDDLVFSLESLGRSTRDVTSDTFKSELQIEFIDRLVDADKLYLLVYDLEKYSSKMTQDSLEYLEWVYE